MQEQGMEDNGSMKSVHKAEAENCQQKNVPSSQ